MIITQKIKKIGGSYSIIIPSNVIKTLEAKEDDSIIINILDCVEKLSKTYLCLDCHYRFDSNEEDVYCPNCENDKELRLKVIEDETIQVIEESIKLQDKKLSLIRELKGLVNSEEEYNILIEEEKLCSELRKPVSDDSTDSLSSQQEEVSHSSTL